MRKICFILGLIFPGVEPSIVQADSVRQIASELRVAANGCTSELRTFTVEIPDADALNAQYQGALAGIEVRHWGHGVRPSYSNLQFINDGDALSITLNARGAGHRSKYPPAKPGALEIEPLIAATGALTRPRFLDGRHQAAA